MSVELTVIPAIKVLDFDGEKTIATETALHFMWKAGELMDGIKRLKKTSIYPPSKYSDSEGDAREDAYGNRMKEIKAKDLITLLIKYEMNEHPADKANIAYLEQIPDTICLLYFH